MELIGAIATTDGKYLTTDHFGDANIYVIIKLSADNIEILKQIQNTTEEEVDEHGFHHHGNPHKAQSVGKLMKAHNVQVLIGRAFGPNITRMVSQFSIVLVNTETVDETLNVLKQNFDKILENWQAGANRKHLNLRI